MTWRSLSPTRPLASAREAAGEPRVTQVVLAARLGLPLSTLATRERVEPTLQLAHLAQHLAALGLEQEACETCGAPRLRVRRKIDTTTKGTTS